MFQIVQAQMAPATDLPNFPCKKLQKSIKSSSKQLVLGPITPIQFRMRAHNFPTSRNRCTTDSRAFRHIGHLRSSCCFKIPLLLNSNQKMASKLEVEIEVKSSSEKMWKNLKEFVTFFPKAMPDIYGGIDVLEGDGKSAGSIFVPSFRPESKFASYSSKERIEVVDDETKTLSYSFLEGTILQYYKKFGSTVCISAKGEGAIVKYTIEFVKANEEVPNPDDFGDFVVELFHCLDGYLLKNN